MFRTILVRKTGKSDSIICKQTVVPELLRTGNFNNKSKLEDRESGNRALEIQVVKPFEKPPSLNVQKKTLLRCFAGNLSGPAPDLEVVFEIGNRMVSAGVSH